jgi:hypothetical protein
MEFMGRDGTIAPIDRPTVLVEVENAMSRLAGSHPGTLVEVKPLGVALHFRRCPSAEAACVSLASGLAETHGLNLQPGKMMIEVRGGGGDKGTAIRLLMREPDMAGTRPVFMGDDLTDEPGFAAAAELGGAGILVGERRESAALYRLNGVDDTLAWLEVAEPGIALVRSTFGRSATARSAGWSIRAPRSCGAACRASTAIRCFRPSSAGRSPNAATGRSSSKAASRSIKATFATPRSLSAVTATISATRSR